jgi:hypothetical protein
MEREAIGERKWNAISHKRSNGERVGNIQSGRTPALPEAVACASISDSPD